MLVEVTIMDVEFQDEWCVDVGIHAGRCSIVVSDVS